MAVEKNDAVNNVDTSSEKVDQEWDEIAADEKISKDFVDRAMYGDTGPGDPDPGEQDTGDATEKLASFLTDLFSLCFRLITPDWRVKEDESQSLGDAWSAVIIKYLPGRWLRFVPGGGALIEIDALVITVKIVKPRLEIQKDSEHVQNPVSGQPAHTVDLSKKPVSEKSRKKSENPPETMPEVHEVEGGQ